jgi:hypothetical protein
MPTELTFPYTACLNAFCCGLYGKLTAENSEQGQSILQPISINSINIKILFLYQNLASLDSLKVLFILLRRVGILVVVPSKFSLKEKRKRKRLKETNKHELEC